MRIGWIGSVVCHAILLVLTFVAWSSAPPDLPAASSVVPVEIIDKITDVTNVKAMAPPAQKTPDATEITPEGAPQDVTAPTPDAPEAIADPRLKQKAKEEPRRAVTDLRSIADLIDRSKTKDGRKASASNAEAGDHPRDAIGAGTDMTATEADAIHAAIDRRWHNSSDLPNPESYWVTVRIQINANGTLAGQPLVVQTSLPQSNPYMRVAVERALQAIWSAEPLPVAPGRIARATFTMRFQKREY